MKRVLLLTAVGLLTACTAMAGMENARFALHYKPKFLPTKTIPTRCPIPPGAGAPNYSPNWNSTTTVANPLPCSNYTTTTPNVFGEIYLVVGKAGLEGVSGVSFGVLYNGAPYGLEFTMCATGILFPNAGPNGLFPASGGGARVTWNVGTGCANQVIGPDGVHAVVGSFYLYAYEPTVFEVIPNNNLLAGSELAVSDCAGRQTDLLDLWGGIPELIPRLLGAVGLGGAQGKNPCSVVGGPAIGEDAKLQTPQDH